jgi:hypothetical protein
MSEEPKPMHKWEIVKVAMTDYVWERSKDGLIGFRAVYVKDGIVTLYFQRRKIQVPANQCVITFDEIE